jgi:hypothetical protein
MRGLIALAVTATLPSIESRAETRRQTACTALNFCYCINPDNVQAVSGNVQRVRKLMAEQRALGKSIVYLSIPLSTVGGSYFGVNKETAKATRERIEARFGASAVWVLDPAVEGSKPDGSSLFGEATGADYMYMWTQVLQGEQGLGEDFDFIYFTGPSDYAAVLKLTGQGDLEALDRYFDDRVTKDPSLQDAVTKGRISKAAFRNYYGVAPSVAFSLGSHDEWNIVRTLNERRRNATALGIPRQLPVLFDGRSITPGDYETRIEPGDVARCIN